LKQSTGILLIIFVLLAGSALKSSAQGTSNKGTDFWVAYAGHIDGKLSRMTLFLSSDINTTYKVEGNGQDIATGNIVANVITPVFIDPNVVDVHIASSDVVESNKGIHITSGSPISVYSIISNSARTGASLILPTKALGREYYAFSYQNAGAPQQAGVGKSEFTILAVEDNTEVEITPSTDSFNGEKKANSKIIQKLNKGDVYQYQSENDVSGSLIRTLGNCKPIAVFSGSTWTAFCEFGNVRTAPFIPNIPPLRPPPSGGDNLYQQLFPVSSWGKNFVTAPFFNTENGNIDAIRVIVSEDNTNITVNGSNTLAFGTTLSNPYKKGSIITYFTDKPSILKSDKPIGVAQYQTAQNCNPSNPFNFNNQAPLFPGDPEMTILNPIEQTLSDITVFSKLNSVPGVRTNILKYYLNIIIRTADASDLTVNNIAVSNLKKIDNEYSYAVLDVTSSQDQNRIKASGGFVAIAYGYGNVESYAYLAGADVRNLFQNISANTQSAKIITSGCSNAAPKFVLKLPYQSSSIVWDLDDGKGSYTDSKPVFTTSQIDGRTVYSYVYPLADPVYGKIGKYRITAIGQNPIPSGCDASELVSLDFEIFDPPVASFTALSQSCVNASIAFRDTSVANGKKIISWKWDFGDNEFSDKQHPTHIYKKSGTYKVKLIVEGDSGCSSEVFSKDIIIYALPVANFTVGLVACENKTLTFSDESTSSDDKIIKWIWDFGDKSALVEKDSAVPFSHTYKTSGTYIVKLKVLNQNGCESLLFEKSVLVNPSPIVNFGVPEVCIKDSFAQFTDSTIISDDTELSYLWNFGNAAAAPGTNTSTLKNPTHRYTLAGNYLVTLTVTSKSGCATTMVKAFTVNGAIPIAGFDILNSSDLCSNKEVVFRNTSTVDFGDVGKVEWYFDFDNLPTNKIVDENPVPGKEYRFTYPVFSSPATKSIKVRMVAYSGGSCFDEEIRTITLLAAPTVSFSALPNVCQEIAPFRITQASEISGQAGNGAFSGPGISSTGIFNPAQAGVGTHTLKYVFTASSGCADSLTRTITVMPTPLVNAGRDTLILEGGETRLNAVASGSNVTYKWFPSTGLSRDDIPDPVASPTEDIIYTLTVTSDQACAAMDNIRVKVLKQPEVPNAFSPNNDGINDLWNIKYLESYANASVKVFSRYGEVVYQSIKGYSKPWDGQFNGINLPVGTYYYIIDPKTKGRKVISGSVTILR
jgi:gliding motility-associated-like protein